MKFSEQLKSGVILDNPVFMQTIGLCPTLATTTSLQNAIGMGAAATVVLICSNIVISAMRRIIPDKIRIAAFITIIATFVTMIDLSMQAFLPSLASSLGLFLPLIVVNCIILGRAESYASKNGPVVSTFDGLGMGLGFTLALTCIGLVREILGSGAIFGNVVVPEDYHIAIFVLAPGAFFVLAILTALQNKFKAPSAPNGSAAQSRLACGGNCMSCTGSACMANHEVLETRMRQAEEKALAAKKAAVAKKEAELKSATSKKEN